MAATASSTIVSKSTKDNQFAGVADMSTDSLRSEGTALIDRPTKLMDTPVGIWMIEAAASRGDSDAMLLLGNLYLDGKFVTANVKMGTGLLEKAGAAGNVAALETLGKLYLWGDLKRGLVNADSQKAARYLEQAVKAGSVEAERVLGAQLIGGWKLPRNVSRGLALLQDAVARGNKTAKISLAEFYFNGKYVPRNPKLGDAVLEQAAAAGDLDALVALGSGYMWGGVLPSNPDLVVKYLGQAEAGGSVDAKRTLGEQMITGYTIRRDVAGGVKRLEELAAKGDLEAKQYLGEQLAYGRNMPKQWSKGIGLLEEAMRTGSVDAEVSLAEILSEYGTSDLEVKRGKSMLADLARRGNPEVQEYLGGQLIWKASNATQRKQAKDYLTKAGNAGSGSAWLLLAKAATLGRLWPEGESQYAFYADKARKARQTGIDVLEAQRWLWAKNSEKPDWQRALNMLIKSAQSGNPDAVVTLVETVRDGDSTTHRPNPKLALEYLNKFKGFLPAYKFNQQQILIKAKTVKKPSEFAELAKANDLSTAPADPQFYKDLYVNNSALAVYFAQDRLKIRNQYAGTVNGSPTSATLAALNAACSLHDKAKTCKSLDKQDLVARVLAQP
jgi:TPR repeat protein